MCAALLIPLRYVVVYCRLVLAASMLPCDAVVLAWERFWQNCLLAVFPTVAGFGIALGRLLEQLFRLGLDVCVSSRRDLLELELTLVPEGCQAALLLLLFPAVGVGARADIGV